MFYSCSQCSFTAQFESALTMHHQLYHADQSHHADQPHHADQSHHAGQLHHEATAASATTNLQEKSNTVPRCSRLGRSFSPSKEKKALKFRRSDSRWGPNVPSGSAVLADPPTRWTDDIKRVAGSPWIQAVQDRALWKSMQGTFVKQWTTIVATRTSATRLFDKLRSRISRSRTLFSHPEEGAAHSHIFNDISGQSECTSKAMKELGSSVSGVIDSLRDQKEFFACHLCSFDSDRITVLDRHLLNDHKIGIDNLLKLVMAKTKDGLSDETPALIYGIRQPYYKPPDEIIENGEFVIETVTPKIKILKHTSTNTDLKMTDIPDLDNCQRISKEIEKLIDVPLESSDKDVLLEKMQTLNEFMCKFVDSTNTIKKVLTKEFDQNKGNRSSEGPYFHLGLGDQDTPRDWDRARSENLDRNRTKYAENRSDKVKYSSDSFYF